MSAETIEALNTAVVVLLSIFVAWVAIESADRRGRDDK